MRRSEILQKITTFPLIAEKMAEDLLSGDFRSVFRGEGIEFDEVRLYQQGDDVRSIDRNVSARFGRPYVKMYREERELTVCLLLDCSASMFAAHSGPLSRYEQAVFVLALIGFSAERAGQRFAALFFDAEARTVFKPRQGRSHTMAVISAALRAAPLAKGSGLTQAIRGAGRLLKRRSLVILVSDFLASGWEGELGKLCQKHDCIAVRVSDGLESDFPAIGLAAMCDPESGAEVIAGTGSPVFHRAWADWNGDRAKLWQATCSRRGAACLNLSTSDEAAPLLSSFFTRRRSYCAPLRERMDLAEPGAKRARRLINHERTKAKMAK
jgi:uncharacterized protein (DUF58 family)